MEGVDLVGLVRFGVGCFALVVLSIELLTSHKPIGNSLRLLRQFRAQERGLTSAADVKSGIDTYNDLHLDTSAERRNLEYKSLVNAYYDLATLFYEWGWGESFHFANRQPRESFGESIRRHEYYLASKLGLVGPTADKKIVDVGCGIGGPLRNLCEFTGADVTGLTLNPYQVQRGNALIRADPRLTQDRCRLVQGDFMRMPFAADTFDAAYAIEATCHAPDRVGVYAEVYRVLKPGSVFACYEWCMTDGHDPSDATHRDYKKRIEEGDGLPDLCHTSVCRSALLEAGFELLEARDEARHDSSWVDPIVPSWNPFTFRFQFNPVGRWWLDRLLTFLELVRLAPRGTTQTQRMLLKGQEGITYCGTHKTFTPMYFLQGRVPLKKKDD